MRWMLLLLAVGCAWTNQATVDGQRRAAAPPPADPMQEMMARTDHELAEARAREQEPTYVACRTSTTPECMTLVDAHQQLISHLEDRQLRLLATMQERDAADRSDKRERASAAAQPLFPRRERKKELDCRQDPSYPGMPGQIHCRER